MTSTTLVLLNQQINVVSSVTSDRALVSPCPAFTSSLHWLLGCQFASSPGCLPIPKFHPGFKPWDYVQINTSKLAKLVMNLGSYGQHLQLPPVSHRLLSWSLTWAKLGIPPHFADNWKPRGLLYRGVNPWMPLSTIYFFLSPISHRSLHYPPLSPCVPDLERLIPSQREFFARWSGIILTPLVFFFFLGGFVL